MNSIVLEAVRADDNLYNFDITGDLDPTDTIDFRAARRKVDLTDAAALIHKTRGAGITDVNAAQGQFQVRLAPADTSALTGDEALVFHCTVRKADVTQLTTVAKGILRLL